MSYDIYLRDSVSGETLHTSEKHYMTGGTYREGGNTEMWLNVTFNYAPYYFDVFPEEGIRTIYGKTGAESIPILKQMLQEIENKYKPDGEWLVLPHNKPYWRNAKTGIIERDFYNVLQSGSIEDWEGKEESVPVCEGPCDDYWEPTAGNAMRPLTMLMAFAQMRPDGVWDGD